MSSFTKAKVSRKYLPWLVCLSAALFFAYELLQMHIMSALSPMLIQDLKLSNAQFGYLSSTYLFADIIFLLPAGIILDRFSVRKVILAALFLCILGTVGFCRVQTFEAACLCHFSAGIGNGFCFLSCMMLVSRWFPKQRQAFVVGLMITVGMLGGVIAQLPFSLLAETFNWRWAFFTNGIVGIALFALIFCVVKDGPNHLPQTQKSTSFPFWKGIVRCLFDRQNICSGLYIALMNMPLMVIGAVWGTLFLKGVHHIPTVRASFIVSMICFGTIVGSPLYGWISDKMERRRLPMCVGIVTSFAAVLGIMLIPHPSEAMLIALFFSLGICTSSQVLGYPTISESNPKELVGTSMGTAALIIMGMPALIQPIFGKILDLLPLDTQKGFILAFTLFPLGFLFALIALMLIKEPKEIHSTRLANKTQLTGRNELEPPHV